MSAKRILIFSLAYHPVVGGAEVAIKELTDRLVDYEFDMVTLRFSSAHHESERIGNVNVYRLGNGGSYINKMFFIIRAAIKGLSLHRDRKYTAFWAMMTYMSFPISFMRLVGNKMPYVLTLQDGDPFEHVFDRWHMRILKPLLRYGFKHASVVQTISNFLSEWPKKLGYEGRVEVVPNGVDLTRFKNIKTRVFNP
jgi:glycosyltransferase involved in cell wall biosynthesis